MVEYTKKTFFLAHGEHNIEYEQMENTWKAMCLNDNEFYIRKDEIDDIIEIIDIYTIGELKDIVDSQNILINDILSRLDILENKG